MRKYKVLLGVLVVAVTLCIVYLFHYYYIHRYDPLIVRISTGYGLDPALVRALVYEESYFNPQARSTAGAIGLMQVTPIIVREWSRVTGKQQLAIAFPNVTAKIPKDDLKEMKDEDLLSNPEINLRIGCWYLDQLMHRYGNWGEPLPIVLASYNAGPTNALRWRERAAADPLRISANQYIEQIDFPETKRYVRNILLRYRKYKQNQYDLDRIGWLLGKEGN